MNEASMKKQLKAIHKKVNRDTLTTVILGTVLSTGMFILLGGLFYLVFLLNGFILSGFAFWLIYTLIFLLMIVAGRYYRPKEHYDTGNDIYSIRDDYHRLHITAGIILMIPNYVFANLKLIWECCTSKGLNVDFDLAVMIINNPHPDSNFDLNELKIDRVSGKTLLGTLSFLEAANLIYLNPHDNKKIMLTTNGKQLRC